MIPTPRTLLALAAVTALLVPPPAATAAERDRKKKENPTAGAASGEKAGDKTPEKKEKPFDEIVKDTKQIKGLFTFYRKDDEGKVWMEIGPDQLDKTYLLNPTLERGTGEGGLLAAAMLWELPIRFHRVGPNVQMIQVNTLFRADEKKPIFRAVEKGYSDSVLAQVKVESQPHPDRKTVLVDAGTLFLGDIPGISLWLKGTYGTGYGPDKDATSFGPIVGYPQNVEIETISAFRTGDPKGSYLVPDARSLMVHLRYSLSTLPGTGYRPRLADDRVGHFVTVFQDYSDDLADEPDVRYITRWQLEKKDPLAATSEPKQPIVFWIENNVPEEYREAVRDGILMWNSAFEKIGFRNAVQVMQQPDDADWDPADVRYSTIRWLVAPGASFAQGPSRVNPWTGQIYDADIRFGSDMTRFTRREYAEEVAPVARTGRSAFDALASGSYDLRDLVALLDADPAESVRAAASAPAGPASALHSGRRGCDYQRGAVMQARYGADLLAARGAGDKDSPEARQYLRDFIVHVTAHEVGHTLGLRHNFKASSNIHTADLQNASLTTAKGLTGSVMDYTPVNIAPQGVKQGQFWQTTLGAYDHWAIEYAYSIVSGDRPADEKPALEKIASRASDPALAYGTDEDSYGFSSRGIDPVTNVWDIGDDTIAYYRTRLGNARELLTRAEPTFEQPGVPYQKLRDVFSRAIGEYALAGLNVSKTIGGIRQHRDHPGDPNARLPLQPVPAARQREALAFLQENVFGPKAIAYPPTLLEKLAPERLPDIFGSSYDMLRLDYPITAAILSVQSAPLSRIYDPLTLQRVADTEAGARPGSNPFTMAEMFEGVRKAIWSELDGGGSNVNAFRRNLQRRHLDTLVRFVISPTAGTPEDARTLARADLVEIRRQIEADLKAPGRLDRITAAHLAETNSRIDATLEAQPERLMFPRTILSLG